MAGDSNYPSPTTWHEQLAWVRLIRTPGIGPVKFWKLLHQHTTAAHALAAVTPYLHKRGQSIPSQDSIEREFENNQKHQAEFVFYATTQYPQWLHTLEDAPPVLTRRGTGTHINHNLQVAIVGARTASLQGQRLAQSMASTLGEAGFNIISGLARGIDTAAHQGSLITGTVAVVAGGIDIIYPAENKNLYHRICESGYIISEVPLGITPQPTQFARRNRLISGCAAAVVVIEAGLNSGSLITAQYAIDQGRELFAVPGHPYDIRHKGCNKLLREGAHWAESPQDILDGLTAISAPAISVPSSKQKAKMTESDKISLVTSIPFQNTNSLEHAILSALTTVPIDIDDLIQNTRQSAPRVLETLTDLELLGKVYWQGNRVGRLGFD